MNISAKIFIFLIALIGLISPAATWAQSAVLIPPPESAQDKRYQYSEQLLRKVLEKTEARYGKAEVQYSPPMKRDRVLHELQRGEIVHVADAPTRPDFEKALLTVRIPLRKGLLGYRLLLIQAKDKEKFAKIRRIEDLKKLSAGSGSQWSITPVFEQNGFTVAKEPVYERLFQRLAAGEFDYFPRGANEIFDEFEARKEKLPELHIEDSLALYVPLPTYFFVAPNKPELAERIRTGLEAMIKDGSFDKLFLRYHAELIQKAKLKQRRLFVFDNPNLSPETPLSQKNLWLKN